jgi:aldehyde dehydrogenase (NAD+)
MSHHLDPIFQVTLVANLFLGQNFLLCSVARVPELKQGTEKMTTSSKQESNIEPTSRAPEPYCGFTQQFIDGVWCEGSSAHIVKDTNPYDGSVLTEVHGASVEDVDLAFKAARNAQPAWAATTARKRTAIMRRAADLLWARREEIIDLTIRETGGVRSIAETLTYFAWTQLDAAAMYPAFARGTIVPAEAAGEESFAYRKPLGVIAVISPWNAPINLTMRSLAPALALGNAVVLKPSSDTPITGGLVHARIFEEAGLPKGVFNVVVGASNEIGDPVVVHPSSALVSFTGSTPVGRALFGKVGSSVNIKRFALELGGNAPFVVLNDADLDRAAQALVVGRFMHQGQICMSANRAIVDAQVFDAFVEKVMARVRALKFGDPQDRNTVIGPLVNQTQVKSVLAKIEKAKAQGARMLAGGPVRGSQRNIIPPHVFVDVETQYAIAQEESFGPVLPILRARDEAHALTLANDTEFGLSSAVFTRDLERGRRFALSIEAGMTHVNDIPVADSAYAPYGGERNSGLGRFNGESIIEEFTRPHWITTQRQAVTYPF